MDALLLGQPRRRDDLFDRYVALQEFVARQPHAALQLDGVVVWWGLGDHPHDELCLAVADAGVMAAGPLADGVCDIFSVH
jgi:hypothetical protein